MSVMNANSVSCVTKASTAAVPSQAEWIKLFSRQVTQTYTSSVAFMKQLTVIAVSTITYLKKIFPEESYLTETFGGIHLKILKTKCEDESAQFISTALIQSFAALEKKYLDKLVLCLYEGSCHVDNLVEAHSFEFSYSPAGVSMDVRSATGPGREGAAATLEARATLPRDRDASHVARHAFENVRKRTLDLLHQTCVAAAHKYRSENQEPYDICLRLYYNSEAPAGYQAPGFSPVPAEAGETQDPLAPALAEAAALGCVETPYHRLLARAYIRDMASSHEANASPNDPMMTQNENGDTSSEQQAPPLHTESAANKPASGARAAPAPAPAHAPPAALRCACSSLGPADDTPLFTCEYCGTLQHAECYGFARGARPPAPACCARCADLEPARAPACAVLAVLPPRRRQGLCLFRRSLAWATRARAVSARAMAARLRLPAALAHKLLRSLRDAGVLRGACTDFDSPQEVDHEQLEISLNKFFQFDKNSLVERLLSESLSQEEASDPVGHILGPEEQISLQLAGAAGTVVQHSPPDLVLEDTTLQQYKEALFSTDTRTDEELPLSGTHNPIKSIRKAGEKTVSKRKMDKPEQKQLRPRLSTKKVKVK